MDILPRPLSSSAPPVEVPLLDLITYEYPQDFESFPERHGFGLPVDPATSPEDLAKLMQSWLFFGLLAEYWGQTLDTAEMVKYKHFDGERVPCVSLELLGKRPGNFSACLQKLDLVRKLLDEFDRHPSAGSSPVPEVALSIHILADVLVVAAGFDSPSPAQPPFITTGNLMRADKIPGPLQIILNRFRDNGWCPARVRLLCQQLGYIPLYYLSDIQRHHPHGLDHHKCSDTICVATALRKEKIDEPQHIQPDCKCLLQRVPLDKVIDIIEKERNFPLIRISRDSVGHLTVDVEAATSRSRYVAISHIWSDGLGNAAENATYRCQLEQLMSDLSDLPVYDESSMLFFASDRYRVDFQRRTFRLWQKNTSHLFWLDVLCIPAKGASAVNSSYLKRLRRMAIAQIPSVFAGAAQVLVLDSELRSLRLGASQTPEVMGRFLGCNWATRAWTYHEGSRSLKCRVRLADGSFDPRDEAFPYRSWTGFVFKGDSGWVEDLEDMPSSHWEEQWDENGDVQALVQKYIFYEYTEQIGSWFPQVVGNDVPEPDETTFLSTWNNLSIRSTTDADDLVTMLATALQIPLHEVLAMPSHQRLKAIIWSLSRVPLSLLLLPRVEEGPSQEQDDRWVPDRMPSSIPTSQCIMMKGNFGEFSESKDRITFQFNTTGSGIGNVFILPIPGPPPKESWFRLDYGGSDYTIRFHRSANPVLETQSFVGAILVIDPGMYLYAADNQDHDGVWVSGCSLLVQDAALSAEETYENTWNLNAVYDCSISVLLSKQTPGSQASESTRVSRDSSPAATGDDDAGETASALGWSGRDAELCVTLACNPPDQMISSLPRDTLLAPMSWLLPAYPSIMLFNAIYWCCMISFIVSNTKTGFAGLTPTGKAALLSWYLPQAFGCVVAAVAIPYNMYLFIYVIFPLLVIFIFAVCPAITLLLFVLDHQREGQPYLTSDIVWMAAIAALYLSYILIFLATLLIARISRRLWLASHGRDTLMSSSPTTSIFRIADWRKAFATNDWVANVMFLVFYDPSLRKVLALARRKS